MLQADLDAQIAKIISPKVKPESTQNSWRRKYHEKRRIRKLLRTVRYTCDYDGGIFTNYICGKFKTIRYKKSTGVFKKMSPVRFKLRLHRFFKRQERRDTRRLNDRLFRKILFELNLVN